jgi:uncharacterized membrane protein
VSDRSHEGARTRVDDARYDRIDDVVRWTLAASLGLGFAILLVGVALVAAGRGSLPTDLSGFGEARDALTDFRAEGVFALGLLVIILTPFVRVIGSAIAFAVARDWRFVLITLTVLGVMVVTIRIGVA